MLVSIVTTVRNEERNLAALLDSLLVQEPPFEVLIVEAYSEDKTWEIAKDYASRHPDTVRALRQGGSRGEGRNFGIGEAKGERVAFIDGDCLAAPSWLKELRGAAASSPVVAGRTVLMGYRPFAELSRVELTIHGTDVSYPSSNLMYETSLVRRLKGFDPRFQTAEDIDLNFRAVEAGATIVRAERAVVYARARDTFYGFFRQAFWNGYGRKQLTLKHGALWGSYSLQRFLVDYTSIWYGVRLALGLLGYLVAKVRESPKDFRGDDRA
ncbi:MAG TPA: glycosyltransferase [Candidatus Thermoplasmatota archaeon]|nr:glycosyltransferase [Candidatus Thermoplasmatota archaeon]